MILTRRALVGGALALPLLSSAIVRGAEPDLAGLSDLVRDVPRIGAAEFARRLARAQSLMREHGIGSVLIEPGASLTYFTGIRWGRSERLTAAILPVDGPPCIVTPFFEEPRTRETLAIQAAVRVWQEDEDALSVVAGFLRDNADTVEHVHDY